MSSEDTNEFSVVASDAVARLRELASKFEDQVLPQEAVFCLDQEIDAVEKTLIAAFEYRKTAGPKLGMADTDVYFREKLGSFVCFAKMAFKPSERGGYTSDKILDNVDHYSYLVANLVSADWESRAKKPKSDKVIRKSSFDNREALRRLADR